MTDDLVKRLRKVEPDAPGERTRWYRNPDGPEAADRIEQLEKYKSLHSQCDKASLEVEKNLVVQLRDAHKRIKLLEAALRTIDNAIPKNDPTLPAICLVAGDVAESALNGTWPAFGVMPRAALEGKGGEKV